MTEVSADSPSQPKRKRRWVGWVYLALLLTSWVWLWFSFITKTPTADHQAMLSLTDHAQKQTAKLVFEDAGPDDAPTVLLLHGSPGSHDNFKYLADHLTPTFRLIMPDMPGYGESQTLVNDHGIVAQARWMFALMDHLNIEQAQVVGFSFGGGVAIAMAHLQPERVESLTLIGGMGVMEHEGSGDYGFEQFKYHAGYPFIVLLPELIPHFGVLGHPASRHAFSNSFIDTDLRPVADWLQAWDKPMLILHGRDDFLVPDRAAEKHHELVPHSQLVMFDASHFMVLSKSGSRRLAEQLLPFLESVAANDPAAMQRRTIDETADRPNEPTVLPVDWRLQDVANPWVKMLVIIAGTWILEDPTSIAVGLLIRDGQLDPALGILAIFIGLFVGDFLLYLLGQVLGRTVLKWRIVSRYLPTTKMTQLAGWYEKRGWSVVLVSRFVPGMRLPVYLAAGALRVNPLKFAWWTLLAVLCWIPVIIALVMLLGSAAASPFQLLFGDSWFSFIGAVVLLLIVLRVFALLLTHEGRRKLRAKVVRLVRHEFWSGWLLYLCILPTLAKLAWRYRSMTVWTLCDPAVELGGVIGESKQAIIDKLPQQWVLTSVRVGRGESSERLALANQAVEQVGGWPVIVKPDAAYRGKGIKLVRDEMQLTEALEALKVPVMVQQYHPGPFEAGLFYMRMPGETDGWLFSITDKHFPFVKGDGQSDLGTLIINHPRLYLQADVFMRRLGGRRFDVPTKGERVSLTVAGNHAQGTLFHDGEHLRSPVLEAWLNDVMRDVVGFYFGRLDVRYTDVESFKHGESIGIIELNAATSESTNLYDPHWSLGRSLSTLAEQWRWAFKIGDAVRTSENLQPPSVMTLVKLVWHYHRHDAVKMQSD